MRSSRFRAVIIFICPAVSSTSKMSVFLAILAAVADFGKTLSPRWMCQRSTAGPSLAGLAGDGGHGGLAEHPAVRERRPRFDGNLTLRADRLRLGLGQVRAYLDLVDRERDLALIEQPPQMVRLEIEDPDGPALPSR